MLNHVRGFANAHMLDWAARMLAAAMLVAGLTGEALQYLNAESPAGVHASDEKPSYSYVLTAMPINLMHAHDSWFCVKFASSKSHFCALAHRLVCAWQPMQSGDVLAALLAGCMAQGQVCKQYAAHATSALSVQRTTAASSAPSPLA